MLRIRPKKKDEKLCIKFPHKSTLLYNYILKKSTNLSVFRSRERQLEGLTLPCKSSKTAYVITSLLGKRSANTKEDANPAIYLCLQQEEESKLPFCQKFYIDI